MDEVIANKEDANSEVNVAANRREYMRELMRKKRAAERVLRESEEDRGGGVDASDAVLDVQPLSDAVQVSMTRTDRKFENDRPGYYIFGADVKERECWMCGDAYKTRMELNKFCGPACKHAWLTSAFGKLKRCSGDGGDT